MKTPLSHRRSLRSTIVGRGAFRSLVVTALLSLASYWHIISLLDSGLSLQLYKYISERGRRETILFQRTEASHEAFKKEWERQYAALGEEEGLRLFDKYFEYRPDDGTWRSRPEWFFGKVGDDGLIHSDVMGFLGPQDEVSSELKVRLGLIMSLLNKYGSGFVIDGTFIDYYISGPENFLTAVIHDVHYTETLPADKYIPDEVYAVTANPLNNPDRKLVWTRLYLDEQLDEWMVSGLMPIYDKNRFIATLAQDILLNDFIDRSLNDRLEGAQNVVFSRNGILIAYEPLLDEIRAAKGLYQITPENPELWRIFETVEESADDALFGVIPNVNGNYLAWAQITGPDWFFVTMYPESLLQNQAITAVAIIVIIGSIGLLTEFGVMWMLISHHVLTPLREFTQRVQSLTPESRLKMSPSDLDLRSDEFGDLSRVFREMADQVNEALEREAKTKAHLEQLVAQRTADLEAANARLRKLSTSDPLTGIYNKKYFTDVLASDAARASRVGGGWWMMMAVVNVDYFDLFNETYGHQAGEEVIIKTAHTLDERGRRDGDICFRLEDATFAILTGIDNITEDSVESWSKKILESIAEMQLPHRTSPAHTSVTVSVGVVAAPVRLLEVPEELYEMAKDLATLASENGHNRAAQLVIKTEGDKSLSKSKSVVLSATT